MPNRIDITGKRYGRLTPQRWVRLGCNGDSRWECLCDCGRIVEVSLRHLRSGSTKSCGCLKQTATPPNMLPNGEAAFNWLYRSYINSARSRDLAFSLDKAEFRVLTTGDCFYCGTPPAQEAHSRSQRFNGGYVYNGIDRVDNTLGYSKGNCVSCCTRCNIAKHTHTRDEFFEHIRNVAVKHGLV